jgi:tRNA/rRNA methyltransferase
MKAPKLVLVRPRNAENLGAVARVMKNFAMTEWVVVSPNPKLLEVPGMHRLAVKSGDLLETVTRVDTLEEAVNDCSWVVGTTMRLVEGRRRMTPRELVTEALDRNDERWALVFGDERNGLSHDDVRQCHTLSFIPASQAQPSLNLAQAVGVYAYEWAMSLRSVAPAPAPAFANDAMLRTIRSALETALQRAGFLSGTDRHAVDDLVATLQRARLTNKDAGLWVAALKVISKSLPDRPPGP